MPISEPSGSNRTLERIASILDALEHSSASATDLARRTGLSVSTAHRLALSMVDYGFLRRSPDGHLSLGPRFVNSRLAKIALPLLTELRNSTRESVQLWVRRGDDRVCVANVDSRHELRATLPEGARLALPSGSSGRLLAEEAEALEEVAAHGWVESVGRRTPGLGSVSAPVRLRGHTVGAVCLAMPLARVTVSPGRDFGDSVAAVATSIGRELEESAP